MKVKTIGLHTVKFTVSSYFWLALVEIALSACFAVKLLNFIGRSVEQVTMVGLLVRSSKTSKDQNVLVRNLIKPAAF